MSAENISEEQKGNDVNRVLAPVFKGDCHKNIHWYVGVYSSGMWIYNRCVYCGKRQEI